MNPWLLVAVVGLLSSAVTVRIAMWIATRAAFIDQPGREAHKQHHRAIPYGGGAAMMFALAVTLLVAWLPLSKEDIAFGTTLRGVRLPVIAVGSVMTAGLYRPT
jgi:UDP-N-acetylmuramyl pentapeptide phosphotransferase/UDP-N-acetylglucosamine-1-phosphate transferase